MPLTPDSSPVDPMSTSSTSPGTLSPAPFVGPVHPGQRATPAGPTPDSVTPISPAKREQSPGTAEKRSQTEGASTTIKKSSDTRFANASLMLKKDLPNVLPLHLAPIDAFFLADDKPRYPMTSVIRLAFSGQIVPEAFENALEEAIERHPLTSAVIRPAKRGLPCWVKVAGITPWVDWGPLDKPVAHQSQEGFDLSQESGLRFWIRCDQQQTVITVQVHHACTDGTGVYRFLGDLLAIYGQQTVAADDQLPELADVDLRMLRGRRSRLTGMDQSVPNIRKIKHGIAQAIRIFGKRIAPLAIPQANNGNGSIDKMLTPFPGVFSYQFSKDEHKQLREAAASHGAMLNDLLLAEMFSTIVRWNDAQGVPRRNGWLRIMMPSDLREQQDYPMPATNMTAYTFITRRLANCHRIPALIKSIREETARIKHDQLGRGFMDTVEIAQKAPPLLKYLLGRNRCSATTILSNVGDPSKRFTASLPRDKGRVVSGNLILEDVSGVPPLRIQSHATLAIFSYLRKLTISVRCDPYRFTPDDSRKFVDLYADGLRSHLG